MCLLTRAKLCVSQGTECRVLVSNKDIELLIFFCVVYRIGLACGDLSSIKLEMYCVFFLEPSGHSIVYFF